MTGKDLLCGLSYVDEALLAEAGDAIFAEARGSKGVRRGFFHNVRGWRMLGAAAVCVCLAAAAVTGLELLGGSAPAAPETAAVTVQMEEITVNQLTGEREDLRLVHLPNCQQIQWNESDIEAHFGRSLVPAYIPEGLQPSEQNGSATVWVGQDGQLADDRVRVDYYHAYNEDGMPGWTEDAAGEKGFTLTACKEGMLRDFSWIGDEDDAEPSVIGGTEVVVGHRMMDYGPYDETTHEPAGYYDLYVVTFQMEDTSYELVSHQLPLEEVVKVAASFICGTDSVQLR